MSRTILLVLGLLVAAPGVALAEGADAATAQIPKSSPVCIRVASLNRVDVVAKDVAPMLKAVGLDQPAMMLEQMPASALLFAQLGLDGATVDAAKPFYVGFDDGEEPVFVFHAAVGAAWEGAKDLNMGLQAMLRAGTVVCGRPAALAVEARGTPTELRGGDVAVDGYIADLVEKHKNAIDEGFAEMAMQGGAAPGLPDKVRALILPALGAAKEAVYGSESFGYAATWKDGKLWTEGLLRTKPRSGLRTFLARAGEAKDCTDLLAFVPKDGVFVTVDASMAPDWPMKELRTMLDGALGEGQGKAITTLLSAAAPFADHLTGRVVGTFSMTGMMGFSAVNLMEVKEGADINGALAAWDVAPVNAAFKELGIPLGFKLEKSVAKHGETDLHRMSMVTEDPNLAMFAAMTQTYYAAEGNKLVSVSSPTAEDDLRQIIDKIRKGAAVEHPHAKAMAALGRTRNFGMTFNIGALKPLMMMVPMFAPGLPPEAMQAMNQIPDELTLSTSLSFTGGDVHWRGDWPVQEVMKIVEKMRPAAPADGGAEEDEDYR